MWNFVPNVLQSYSQSTGIVCTVAPIPDFKLKAKTAANLAAHSITTMTSGSSYRKRCNNSLCNR